MLSRIMRSWPTRESRSRAQQLADRAAQLSRHRDRLRRDHRCPLAALRCRYRFTIVSVTVWSCLSTCLGLAVAGGRDLDTLGAQALVRGRGLEVQA
jgi:hypothetical protein